MVTLGKANDCITNKNTIEEFNKFKQVSQRYRLTNDSFNNLNDENSGGNSNEKNVNVNDAFGKFKFSMSIDVLLNQNRQECNKYHKMCHLYCSQCMMSMAIETRLNLTKDDNNNSKDNSNENKTEM